jgi:chromosome segregation ATPase
MDINPISSTSGQLKPESPKVVDVVVNRLIGQLETSPKVKSFYQNANRRIADLESLVSLLREQECNETEKQQSSAVALAQTQRQHDEQKKIVLALTSRISATREEVEDSQNRINRTETLLAITKPAIEQACMEYAETEQHLADASVKYNQSIFNLRKSGSLVRDKNILQRRTSDATLRAAALKAKICSGKRRQSELERDIAVAEEALQKVVTALNKVRVERAEVEADLKLDLTKATGDLSTQLVRLRNQVCRCWLLLLLHGTP